MGIRKEKRKQQRMKIKRKSEAEVSLGSVRQKLPDQSAATITAGTMREMEEKLAKVGLKRDDVFVGVTRRALWGRNEPCPCKSGKKFKHCCQDKLEVTFTCQLPNTQLEKGAKRIREANEDKEKGSENKPQLRKATRKEIQEAFGQGGI